MSVPGHSAKATFNALCQVAQVCAEELQQLRNSEYVDSSENENFNQSAISCFLNFIGSTGIQKIMNSFPKVLKSCQR